MSSRFLEDNVGKFDYDFIQPHLSSFDGLLALFKAAKLMKVESLYQLCAAALASWFRCKCLEDVKKELGLQSD